MRKTQLAVLASITITINLISCQTSPKNDMQRLGWILVKWQSNNEEGSLFEEWTNQGDTAYAGHAYALSEDGDTTFSERAVIKSSSEGIIYSVTVNAESTTDFLLVDFQDQAVFENMAHDYPQRIIYRSKGSDSLLARIEGMVDGVEQSEDFNYAASK